MDVNIKLVYSDRMLYILYCYPVNFPKGNIVATIAYRRHRRRLVVYHLFNASVVIRMSVRATEMIAPHLVLCNQPSYF